MLIIEILSRNARKFAKEECLSYAGQHFTWAEVAAAADRAAGLLQSWGVAKGDVVALMSLNTPSFVISFFGALKAGAAVVPINHKLAPPEVDYILEHSEAKVFLFDGALASTAQKVTFAGRRATLDSAVPGVDHFDALLAGARPVHEVGLAADDVAEILYTSGTTGRPKGCLHSHRTATLAALTGALVAKMDRKDRLLMAMPIWHSSPLNNWFLGAFYVGAAVVLLREYHPLHFLQTVQAERTTVTFASPPALYMPMRTVPTFAGFDLSSMRAWLYGGGPMAADTAREVVRAYRCENFFQVYGMTEAGPTGTTLFPEEQLTKAGSIGRVALPGADLRVVRGGGKDAGSGEAGEIWLKADSMMLGYHKDPEATRAAFTEGWYRSGDVARVDADGYLTIVDRLGDVIVTGGENVYSKEVEDAFAGCPSVVAAAVVGRPDPVWGESVVAFVLPDPKQPTDPETVRAYLDDRLARYKVPREIRFVDALPLTPTGKVMKFKLREQLACSTS